MHVRICRLECTISFSKIRVRNQNVFVKLTTPYVMFESKKTQILIEFLDGTKKVQLVGKKSSASV